MTSGWHFLEEELLEEELLLIRIFMEWRNAMVMILLISDVCAVMAGTVLFKVGVWVAGWHGAAAQPAHVCMAHWTPAKQSKAQL